ncbi:MAG: hypothetical protein IKL07_03295 [Clostridium sp.]|nr:hypothetical protein [Clostridium sp.]
MRDLSVMEQKQVVGGYWCVKVYRYDNGSLVEKHYENTKQQCIDWFHDNYNAKYYNDVYVEIR